LLFPYFNLFNFGGLCQSELFLNARMNRVRLSLESQALSGYLPYELYVSRTSWHAATHGLTPEIIIAFMQLISRILQAFIIALFL